MHTQAARQVPVPPTTVAGFRVGVSVNTSRLASGSGAAPRVGAGWSVQRIGIPPVVLNAPQWAERLDRSDEPQRA
jgi:hypothetical protein